MHQTYLIFGSLGQLGRELLRQLGKNAYGVDLPEGNITDPASLSHLITRIKPDVIFNAAAFTQVDLAEKNPDLCRSVNVTGVENLADECHARNIPLVHFSSDYVFCATNLRRPITEMDPPAPQGVYAQTKYDGESPVLNLSSGLVLRTCGLYGIPGPNTPGNFVDTMLRLGKRVLSGEIPSLRVVSDQHCTPTYIPDLVRAVIQLLECNAHGVYHVTNSGETTWHGFAVDIFRQAHMDLDVTPISTQQWGAPAPRPPYSVLSTEKFTSLCGKPLRHWSDAVGEYLNTPR